VASQRRLCLVCLRVDPGVGVVVWVEKAHTTLAVLYLDTTPSPHGTPITLRREGQGSALRRKRQPIL